MKRKENESFEDYKIRRAEANKERKLVTKGSIFWPTKGAGIFLYPNGRPERKERAKLVTEFKEELTKRKISDKL